ncbi:Alpha/Beta hydrolase protein [Neurospora hispaniola]|uniref:Alpha/Beta hydrolase protein n=1 Tax=Neurospora hispaniola TaxID=588809 RepID=A0AAJ0IGB5_9PEZI|nr:Alpha/Beta hydrolase protein [Neurospora hispaniola]
MAVEKESTLKVEGASLYTKSWEPEGPIKAKLIFIHGFSDHINRYYGFFPSLAACGIAVYGFDQRGWGRSVKKPADRGLTGPTSRVIADMVAFIEPHLSDAPGAPPVFIMGHSMGGGQVLTLACDEQYQDRIVSRVRGWLLESPFIGFAPELKPGFIKVYGGRFASKIFPHRQMVNQIPPEDLSRDPEVQKSIAADELLHNTGTLEGLSGMLDRTDGLTRGTIRPVGGENTKIKAIWLGHGSSDKATDYNASKRYYDRVIASTVKDRMFKRYEGWFHQLHADGPCSEEFYKDVGDWILERGEDPDSGKFEAKI